MRLKKASLIAASLVLSSLPTFAVDIGTSSYGTQITTVVGDPTVLTGGFSGSIKELLGGGDFVVDVQGKLQYLGFQGADVYFDKVHNSSRTFPDARIAESFTPLEMPQYITTGMTGSITVNQGALEVAGYLNVWVQYPRNMTNFVPPTTPANNSIIGVSGVILNKGTEINFTNTPLNVLNNLAAPLGGNGTTLSRRYNMVHNIKSGANNDQIDTTFSAGIDNTYRIVIYADNVADGDFNLGAAGNSIGKLAGAGDVYKFGAADLKILGESERGVGRFTVANGSVTLASAGGLALATATSVNLAGTDSRQGAAVGETYNENPPHGDGNPDRWKEAYTPNPGVGALVITNNQTIRNLQADFAYTTGTAVGTDLTVTVARAVLQAATGANADEAVIAGAGRGSSITIDNNTLSIIQDRDGVYRGDIIAATHDGRTGTVVISGTATIALLLGNPSAANFMVAQGSSAKLIANAQGLGVSTVNTRNLSIFQDNAGSLNATLTGSSDLNIIASATLNNGSGTPIQLNENGVAGSLLFAKAQSQFTGAVHAFDGVTLEFSSLANNALITASSINLHAPTGIGTVTGVRLGDSIQTFRGLNGDVGTQLDLSRGTLYLNGNSSFAGKIIGAGNLVNKAGSMVLNGATDAHLGATVIQSGSLSLVGGGLQNSSGLALGSTATFNLGNQNVAVGALFGQVGSAVNLGSGTLTVGTSALRATQLRQELAGGTPLSTNYLGTSATAIDLSGAAVAAFDTSGLGGAPVDVADATRLFLQNIAYSGSATAAADAANLDFAGSIAGTGGLTKIGGERLTLTGVNTYTGATLVQAGVLRVNYNSLAGTSGVTVSLGAALALNAGAGVDGAFDRKLTGSGAVIKVGQGKVTLTGDFTGFTGGLTVEEGTLQVNTAGNLAGTVTVNNSTTLILNQATGEATLTAPVSNSGTLTKIGAGKLTIAAYSGSGAIDVSAGTLALSTMPVFPAALNVAKDAVFVGTVAGSVNSGTQVTTAGTGANGVISLIGGGILTATANDLFSLVTLDLNGVTFNLAGTTQHLGGFSGLNGASVALGGGSLVFAPAAGVRTEFDGLITGAGTLEMSGAGTTALISTAVSSWTGATNVLAGTLEATPEALGNSVVTVNAPGKIALRNTDTAVQKTYANDISGNGIIGKTGVGAVLLSGASGAFTGSFEVAAGRLILASNVASADTAAVSVAAPGAVFQINDRDISGARALLVTGAGSLALSGANTITLTGLSYTGNTILVNGADLNVAALTAMNGLATEGAGQSTSLVTTGGALTVTQNVAGTFAGQFTPSTAFTLRGAAALAIAGDLASRGLSSVTVDGGILQVDAGNTTDVVNNGTVNIAATGAQRYTGAIAGTGAVTIVATSAAPAQDKISFGDGVTTGVTGNPYVLQSIGLLTVGDRAILGGVFTTSGALTVASGGTLAPGNSPGTVTVNGAFTLASGGTLAVEINAATSDKVVVNGAASIAGVLKVSQDATPGSALAGGGREFTLLTATGGVIGAFSNASVNGIVTLDTADQAATGIRRVQVLNTGSALEMRTLASIRDLAGFTPHEGIGGLIDLLDSQFLAGTAGGPLQALFDSQIGSASFSGAVNNLSPLGYASEYAMAQDGENRRVALLHDRLEQRRYDRGSPLTTEDAPWEAFVVGSAAFADNKSATDTPVFNYRTFGGMAGLDRKLNDELVLGAAVSYDNGSATIHDNGGKVDMNRAAGTLFLGGQLTKRWYFDLGLTGGYGLYESKRNTAAGSVKGENGGFSGGLNAETGTVFVLTKDLHLTPYVGVAYTHHEYDGFTETGSPTALKLDGWSQDSLRAKVGTGLGWFIPMEWVNLKVGIDVAYAHELLDTDSEIDARFASGGAKFRTTAAAIPQDSVTATPSLGFEFNDSTSATFSYGYEIGFDGRSYQSVNFAVRKRF